jgi:hypothetical protein
VGVQQGAAKKPDTNTTAAGFSPAQRAKRASEQFRAQVMELCHGSISDYEALMASDVDTYLLKFEQSIKEQQRGKGSNNIRG